MKLTITSSPPEAKHLQLYSPAERRMAYFTTPSSAPPNWVFFCDEDGEVAFHTVAGKPRVPGMPLKDWPCHSLVRAGTWSLEA